MGEALTMTEDERLKLENLTLKLTVMQTQFELQAAPVIAAREQLGRVISDRLGIDPEGYDFNIDTGLVTAKPEAPGQP